jgi:asparagine synthase (glutamine-hydrolysing)
VCGIVGVLAYNSDTGSNLQLTLKAMSDSIYHRGPDDWGVLLAGRRSSVSPECYTQYFSQDDLSDSDDQNAFQVGLASRRLAIIDLSPAGRMPLCNEDGTIWITYNGEIFNYRELMRELEQCGHRFRSCTDTEVIIHAYEEWGVDAANRFNGMWAFGLWDAGRQRLWLSRDRFGIKPLYYSFHSDKFYFASEVKAIRAAGVTTSPCLPYLAYFLQSGIMSDGDESFYTDVKQLLPAHSLVIDGQGHLSQSRYWAYPKHIDSEPLSIQEYARQFGELFEDAVRLRLRSDVPIGACLSGGLDSSSVVTMYRKISPDSEFHTFSVIFDEDEYNETDQMKKVLTCVRTQHHFIRASADGLMPNLSTLVQHMDGPHLSSSTYPYWLMLTEVGKSLKVLLDGQGADELLAGYRNFQMGWLESSFSQLLHGQVPSPHFWSGVANILAGQQWPLSLHIGFWTREKSHLFRRLQDGLSKHRHVVRRELLEIGQIDPDRTYASGYTNDPLTNLLHKWHSCRVLPGLLQYGDALSMASSVEVRLPFLDHRLVELVFAMPYYLKHSGLESKYVLRQAMIGLLPDEVRLSRQKIGFTTPFSKWLRSSLKDPVRDIILARDAKLRDYLNYDLVEAMFYEHIAGKRDQSSYLWRYLLAEVWLQSVAETPMARAA